MTATEFRERLRARFGKHPAPQVRRMLGAFDRLSDDLQDAATRTTIHLDSGTPLEAQSRLEHLSEDVSGWSWDLQATRRGTVGEG